MRQRARFPAVEGVRGEAPRAGPFLPESGNGIARLAALAGSGGDGSAPRLAAPPASLAGEPLVFFWSHPESGVRAAAFGESARAEASDPAELRELLTALTRPDAVRWLDGSGDSRSRPPGPFFGAIAFDPAGPLGRAWAGYAPIRFAAPRILVWWEGARAHAAAFGEHGRRLVDEALAQLESVPAARPLGRMEAAPANGARAGWGRLVGAALERIGRGELHKVVLARAVEVHGDSGLPVPALLAELEARHPSCRTFLLRGDRGEAFLGATPETFCRLDGARLATEALAGSAPLSEADALPRRSKDLREHAWVVEHLVASLRGISDAVEVPSAPGVRRLTDVAHLHTPVQALLRGGAGLADVVEALHPTPAVGGVPAPAAMRFIAESEALERGLYAGLVGVCGPGRAELDVALRCALVAGNDARLFVGAGVVAGSTAESEWGETELKARALLGALGAGA